MASPNALAVPSRMRVLCLCGEVTLPTLSDTSPPRPSTSLSATPTSRCSPSRRSAMVTGSGWLVTWPPAVLLVPPPFSSSTLSTMLGTCFFPPSLIALVGLTYYDSTRLANDAKSAKKGGERQFNGLIDVYRKTLASDGIAGLYRGFGPSVLGIIVYRGLYFGLYDSIKPVLLVGPLEGNFLASFLLGWGVTTGAGIASYPLDTIRRRMMMTSGEVCTGPFPVEQISDRNRRLSSTRAPSMLPSRSWLLRVSDPSSRELVPTSSVVSLVPVCSPSMTVCYSHLCAICNMLTSLQRSNFSSSERPTRAVPAKRLACIIWRLRRWLLHNNFGSLAACRSRIRSRGYW